MKATLVVIAGRATQREVVLELPAAIGRDRDSALAVLHSTVSRRHCELVERDGKLVLRDLGSTNGTFIGAKRISEAVLEPGAQFTVGPLTFSARYEPVNGAVRTVKPAPAEASDFDLLAEAEPAAAMAAPVADELDFLDDEADIAPAKEDSEFGLADDDLAFGLVDDDLKAADAAPRETAAQGAIEDAPDDDLALDLPPEKAIDEAEPIDRAKDLSDGPLSVDDDAFGWELTPIAEEVQAVAPPGDLVESDLPPLLADDEDLSFLIDKHSEKPAAVPDEEPVGVDEEPVDEAIAQSQPELAVYEEPAVDELLAEEAGPQVESTLEVAGEPLAFDLDDEDSREMSAGPATAGDLTPIDIPLESDEFAVGAAPIEDDLSDLIPDGPHDAAPSGVAAPLADDSIDDEFDLAMEEPIESQAPNEQLAEFLPAAHDEAAQDEVAVEEPASEENFGAEFSLEDDDLAPLAEIRDAEDEVDLSLSEGIIDELKITEPGAEHEAISEENIEDALDELPIELDVAEFEPPRADAEPPDELASLELEPAEEISLEPIESTLGSGDQFDPGGDDSLALEPLDDDPPESVAEAIEAEPASEKKPIESNLSSAPSFDPSIFSGTVNAGLGEPSTFEVVPRRSEPSDQAPPLPVEESVPVEGNKLPDDNSPADETSFLDELTTAVEDSEPLAVGPAEPWELDEPLASSIDEPVGNTAASGEQLAGELDDLFGDAPLDEGPLAEIEPLVEVRDEALNLDDTLSFENEPAGAVDLGIDAEPGESMDLGEALDVGESLDLGEALDLEEPAAASPLAEASPQPPTAKTGTPKNKTAKPKKSWWPFGRKKKSAKESAAAAASEIDQPPADSPDESKSAAETVLFEETASVTETTTNAEVEPDFLSPNEIEALSEVREPFIDQNFELDEETPPSTVASSEPANEALLSETVVFKEKPADEDPLADLESKEARLMEEPALDFGDDLSGPGMGVDELAETIEFIPSELASDAQSMTTPDPAAPSTQAEAPKKEGFRLWPFGRKSGEGAASKTPKPAKTKKQKKAKKGATPEPPLVEEPIAAAAEEEPLELDFDNEASLDLQPTGSSGENGGSTESLSDDDAINFLNNDAEIPPQGSNTSPPAEQPDSAPAAGTSGKSSKELSDAELDEFLKGF